MMSTAAPARGRCSKCRPKCGFNQLCSDTQVLSLLQEVPNETDLFSFHLTKPWQREERRKALIELAPAGEQFGVLGWTGQRKGVGAVRSGDLGIGNAACGQHSAPAPRRTAGSGDLGMLPVASIQLLPQGQQSRSQPWLWLCRCEWVRGRFLGFSPVIPNALPAELASFPPAFYCLPQVVGKDLFPFFNYYYFFNFFFCYYNAVKTCIDSGSFIFLVLGALA